MTHDDFDAFAPRPRSRSQQPHSEAQTVSFDRPDYDAPVRYDAGPEQSRGHVGQHSDPYRADDPGPPRRGGRHWFWVIGAVVLALVGVTGLMLVFGGLTNDGSKPRAADKIGTGQAPTGPGASFPVGSAGTPGAPAPGAPGRGSAAAPGAPGASGAAPGAPGAAPGAPGSRPGGSTAAGGPVAQHPKPTGNQRAIPNVVGLRMNDALRTLRRSGFRAGALFIATDNRAQVGTVLRQSPDAGAPLDRGLGVTILVGAGR
jgi:PASTA domain